MADLSSPAAKAGTLCDGDILLFVSSSVYHLKCVLVGYWPAWPSRAIVLAAAALLGQSGQCPTY